MKNFCQVYGSKNIVKDKTYFRNPIDPTSIGLTVTNRPKSTYESKVIETRLSDFLKMGLMVRMALYNNQKLTVIQ